MRGDEALGGDAGAGTLNGDIGFDVAGFRGSTGAIGINLIGLAFAGDALGDPLLAIERIRPHVLQRHGRCR